MISDLHLGSGVNVDKAKGLLIDLCSKIREQTSPTEEILFIIMGDIINASDTTAFNDARVCLDCILQELDKYRVHLEFIPGNHDLPEGNIEPFDKFIAEYGVTNQFGKSAAYSRIYENVNFIFADSNIRRKHNLPGELNLDAIKNEVKPMKNLLFCHHGFTHDYGGSHDTIDNGTDVIRILSYLGINFVFHGHAHRADYTVSQEGLPEIGCGTLFKNTSDMDRIPNQFSVGYIHAENLVRVDRYIISGDGGNSYPCEELYPSPKTFSDPSLINKLYYTEIPQHISRKVISHISAIMSVSDLYFMEDKEISLQEAIMKNEKILFLSDAGQGKSVELQNLAHSLYETLYFPFLYKLRNYSGETIEHLLPEEYRKLAPHYLTLLFDGYDELSTEDRNQFEKQLNLYVEKNPSIHIVISSRSNFCKAESNNESRTFPGFYIYDLCKLSDTDVALYLESEGIEYRSFRISAHSSQIEDLIFNPFYLARLCNLYKKHSALPSKAALMDALIQECFDIDDAKFPGNLEDYYYNLMILLGQHRTEI